MKKNQIAKEVTETVFSTEVRSVRHQRNSCSNKGYSVFSEIFHWAAITKLHIVCVNSIHCICNVGGAVVFDDIDENWKGLRLATLNTSDNRCISSVGSTPSPPGFCQPPPAHFFKVLPFYVINYFTYCIIIQHYSFDFVLSLNNLL